MQPAVRQPSTLKKYLPLIITGVVLVCLMLVGIVVAAAFIVKGGVSPQGITFSTDKAVYGEKLSAIVELRNSGFIGNKYKAVLTVDGVESETRVVALEGRQTKSVDFDISGYDAGTHKVSLGKVENSIKILKPAAFEVQALSVEPVSLLVGKEYTVTAKVANTGEVAGDYAASFKMDGLLINSEKVPVQPGAAETITLKAKAEAGGKHVVELDGKKAELTILRPAEFTVMNLKLSKMMAKLNEKVSIAGTVSNSGDVDGKYTVKLIVNGKAEQSKELTLKAKQRVPFSFTLSKAVSGQYKIEVGKLTTSVLYVNIVRPANGTLLVKAVNGGRGRLNITNNHTDRDVYVVFTSAADPTKTLLSVYVQAGKSAKNIKVKDGTYIIYYATGTNFDGSSRRFMTNAQYNRFNDLAKFKTTQSGYTITYSIQTLTFNSGSGGSPTTDVGESGMPR